MDHNKKHSKHHDGKRRSSAKKEAHKSGEEKEKRNSGARGSQDDFDITSVIPEGSVQKNRHNHKESKKDLAPKESEQRARRYTHIVTHHPAVPQPHPVPPVNVEDGHHHHKRHSKDRGPSHKNFNEGKKRHSHDHKKRHSKDHDHDQRRSSRGDEQTQPQASGDQQEIEAQHMLRKLSSDKIDSQFTEPNVNVPDRSVQATIPSLDHSDKSPGIKPSIQKSYIVPGPEGLPSDIGLPFEFFDETAEKKLEATKEDKQIDEKLSEIMDQYRGELKRQARQGKKNRYPTYTYSDIVAMLTKQGIPVPADDDFARLESTHGTRWDPDGTIVEYYSPVLRSFIPINMRGRYRGCWAEDKCIQGLDISKLGPKPDALEGFIDRNRQIRIQEKYDVMGDVAIDEGHLDYLIEIQKYQAEILPIPIFYEVLDLGMETLNENLKVLAAEEGFPPQSRVYETTELQAKHVRRKLQLYAALGLEPLDSRRTGLGRVNPLWEKTRDQIINSLLARRHQEKYILQMRQEHEAKLQAEEQENAKETNEPLIETENYGKGQEPMLNIPISKVVAEPVNERKPGVNYSAKKHTKSTKK